MVPLSVAKNNNKNRPVALGIETEQQEDRSTELRIIRTDL